MKTTFVVVAMFVLSSAAAFGQISANASPLRMAESSQHADYRQMGNEQSLIGGSVTSAQGERPLWEFGPVSVPVSLCDRRAQHRRAELPDCRRARTGSGW